MIEVLQTVAFTRWLNRLRDARSRGRILARVRLLESGHFGDVAPVGEGVSEMRIHFGPRYRVYFVRRGEALIILLAGGDKSSQPEDVRLARRLAKEY